MPTDNPLLSLNQLAVHDEFNVRVFNRLQDVHYFFAAHGDLGDNRPAKFRCHVYDSAAGSHATAVRTGTVATDGHGHRRCSAEGKTLDELVHNLDWPHRPSELAQLRMLLAARRLTDSGRPVGDLVFRREAPSPDGEPQTVLSGPHLDALKRQADQMRADAAAVVDAAVQEVLDAAKYGLHKELKPRFGQAAPL
jgi:hypothetical protein